MPPMSNRVNPIRPSLLRVSSGPVGGPPDLGLTSPGYIKLCSLFKHHLIQIRFGMSTDATKIDFSNFHNLEEITLQRYISPSRREQEIKFGYLTLKNEFYHKKRNFMSRTVLSDPKLTSPVSFNNFQTEKTFLFSVFWTSRREMSSSNPPGCLILLKWGCCIMD